MDENFNNNGVNEQNEGQNYNTQPWQEDSVAQNTDNAQQEQSVPYYQQNQYENQSNPYTQPQQNDYYSQQNQYAQSQQNQYGQYQNQNDYYAQQDQYNNMYGNQYNQPQYGYNNQYPQNQYDSYNNTSGRGFSIASLVLGIVSLCTCCGGLIPAILGLVFGIISKSRQSENNTRAVVGIILSAIGIVWAVVSIVLINVSDSYYWY